MVLIGTDRMDSDLMAIYNIKPEKNGCIERDSIACHCVKKRTHQKWNSLLLSVLLMSGHHMPYFNYALSNSGVSFVSFPLYEYPFLGSKLLYCQHAQVSDRNFIMKSGLLTSVQMDAISPYPSLHCCLRIFLLMSNWLFNTFSIMLISKLFKTLVHLTWPHHFTPQKVSILYLWNCSMLRHVHYSFLLFPLSSEK